MSNQSKYYIWFRGDILVCYSLEMIEEDMFMNHFLYTSNDAIKDAFYVRTEGTSPIKRKGWYRTELFEVPKEFLLALSLEGIR